MGGGGAPLASGEELNFLFDHFCYFTMEIESFIFHLRIGYISTIPYAHLFISPIFPTKIILSKNLQPPSILMVSPLVNVPPLPKKDIKQNVVSR